MTQTPHDPQQNPGTGGSDGQGFPSAPPAYPSAAQGAPQAYPAAPGGGSTGQAGPVSRPKPLDLAVKLMYAGAALSLVGILVSLTQQDTIRQVVEDTEGVTADMVDGLVAFSLITSVVTGLLGTGLWILNAVFNAKGKKWARILSTVLGGLSIVFFLLSLVQPATGLSMVLGVVQVALAAAILWLLWRPESSRFYEAMSAPRY